MLLVRVELGTHGISGPLESLLQRSLRGGEEWAALHEEVMPPLETLSLAAAEGSESERGHDFLKLPGLPVMESQDGCVLKMPRITTYSARNSSCGHTTRGPSQWNCACIVTMAGASSMTGNVPQARLQSWYQMESPNLAHLGLREDRRDVFEHLLCARRVQNNLGRGTQRGSNTC